MNHQRRLAVIFVASFIVSIGISYVLAVAGEPQSVWVWRDVLGVLR